MDLENFDILTSDFLNELFLHSKFLKIYTKEQKFLESDPVVRPAVEINFVSG
jgi:hypothetical protein